MKQRFRGTHIYFQLEKCSNGNHFPLRQGIISLLGRESFPSGALPIGHLILTICLYYIKCSISYYLFIRPRNSGTHVIFGGPSHQPSSLVTHPHHAKYYLLQVVCHTASIDSRCVPVSFIRSRNLEPSTNSFQ